MSRWVDVGAVGVATNGTGGWVVRWFPKEESNVVFTLVALCLMWPPTSRLLELDYADRSTIVKRGTKDGGRGMIGERQKGRER